MGYPESKKGYKNTACVSNNFTKGEKMMKRLIVGILIIISGVSAYSGGTGTSGNPYQITVLADLLELSTTSGDWVARKYFIQTADIDASSSVNWDGGNGFTPIGNMTNNFTGNYDGNMYTISNIYISRPTVDYVGIWGVISSPAKIFNIKIIDVEIIGNNNVGGLVGFALNGGNIDNCSVLGSVVSLGNYSGGLVGKLVNSSKVRNSFADVSLIGNNNVGGLVGGATNSSIIENSGVVGSVTGIGMVGGLIGYATICNVDGCYAKATLSSSGDYSGGLIGYSHRTNIKSSFSTGSVIGYNYAGGLIGGFVGYDSNDRAILNNCFSSGNPTTSNSNSTAGGLVAYGSVSSTTVINSFWDTETSNIGTSIFGTGKTTSQMLDIFTFTSVGWDFFNTWKMDEYNNNGYPNLRWETDKPEFGNGKDLTPYTISTLDNLLWVNADSTRWGYYYIQMANIDMSETIQWYNQKGWEPIGKSDLAFTGNYDGNTYTIENMYINRPNEDYLGLFSVISDNGQVKNLNISNASVAGFNYVGTISGLIESNAVIDNCHASGDVINTKDYLGGLIGKSLSSTIINSSSNVTVNQNCNSVLCGFVGGIVGELSSNSSIISSCSLGEISGDAHIGGLVGRVTISSEILDSYSRSNIDGIELVGGLVGDIYNGGVVENSYSTGQVNGLATVGGLIGFVISGGQILNSFWDMETSGQNSSSQGIGKTTSEMKTEDTFTSAGWDFVTTWGMNDGVNNGYPGLKWQYDFIEISSLTLANDQNPNRVTSETPVIRWSTISNSPFIAQQRFQVEISLDQSFETLLWESGEIVSTVDSLQLSDWDFDDGVTYYSRVKVGTVDIWSSWSTLMFRMNSEPSSPELVSPGNGEVVTTQPILKFLKSNDADGDPLTYSVYLFNSEAMITPIDSLINYPSITDTISWTFTAAIDDNAQYWWCAKSYDGYEHNALTEIRTFILNMSNDAPVAFSLISPIEGFDVTSLTPLLEWNPAVDPDPMDAVNYVLYLDTPAPGVETFDIGTDTSHQVVINLLDNTHYSWKVIASDLNGGSTENTGGYQGFRVNTENDLPTAFNLLAPEDESMVMDLTPTLVWESSSDPDDSIFRQHEVRPIRIGSIRTTNSIREITAYQVYLDVDSLFTETVAIEVLDPEYTPSTDLLENMVYYWKIEAVDDVGGTLFSEHFSFWTNVENEAPVEFALLLPTDVEVLTVLSPTFTWESSHDPDLYDGFGYHILLGSSPEDMDTLWSGEDTTLTLDWELADNTTYYWSVFAEDWSGLVTENTGGYQSFTVNLVNDAPVFTNVSDASMDEDSSQEITLSATDEDGDVLIFSAASSEADVVTSVSGTLLTLTLSDDWNGTSLITLTVDDGTVEANDTFTLTVNPVNDIPIVEALSVSTDEDVVLAITLLGSDVDGDDLTYTIVSDPSHGVVTGTPPNLSYSPNTDYNGLDAFAFKVNDGTVDSESATISITVNPVNDAPTIVGVEAQSTDEDTPTGAIVFVVGDSDTDLDQLILTGSSSNSNLVSEGGFQYSGSGEERTVIITPNPNQFGSTEVTIFVDDQYNGPPVPGDTIANGFETGELLPGWSAVDEDGDGNNWYVYQAASNAHTGDYSMFSESYINDVGALTPNNWLMTPSIFIGNAMELRYWVAAQDPAWASEHYSVKVSTSGTGISDFTTTLYTETLSDGDWHEVVLDLSSFSGDNIHVAWQHHEVTDMYLMKLDDISVVNTVTREVAFLADFEEIDPQNLLPSPLLVKRSTREVVGTTFNFTVNAVNDAPNTFSLLSPENGIEISDPADTLLTFTWETADDVEGDEVVYGISFFGESMDTLATVGGDSIAINVESFPRDVWIEWDVFATDSYDTTWCESSRLIKISSTVDVDESIEMPKTFALHQNYPNPFNPSTTLRYGLPEDASVSLVIYDIRGNTVRTIDSGSQVAGWYEHIWNGIDDAGQPVSTGLYLTRLRAGSYSKTIKMLYLK